MSSGNGGSGILPKWQLALVVGAPVALGLGYMYYRSTSSGGRAGEKKITKGGRKGAVRSSGEKYSSIDGDIKNTEAALASETPSQKAQRFKSEGNKCFNSGKFDEAIDQYNLAIETCPKDEIDELATYYQNRAAAYEKLQKFNSVREDCTKALELKPRYTKALIRRAKALESNKEYETALEDITAACILERFGNSSTLYTADRVLKQLGKQHAQEYMATKKPIMPSKHFIKTYFGAFQNDPFYSEIDGLEVNEPLTPFERAIKALKSQDYDGIIGLCSEELSNLVAKNETNNEFYKMKILLMRGTFYLLLGQHENALSDLDSVINSEKVPKEYKVNALIKRASMHIQLEDPDKTFSDFKEAVELDPDCGDIYHNRGQVNLLLDNVDEAKADFERAVELNPNFGVAYVQKCYTDYRYALSKRDINMVSDSMTRFKRAIEKFPDCSECYTLYAQMLADTQDYAKADDYFHQALDRDPKNATILVHRGLLTLQWKNDIEVAVDYIKKAIEIDDKCELGYETLGTIEVQRGNLKEAINLFDKALALGRTIMELTHIFGLRDAAKAQLVVSERLGPDFIKNLIN